MSETLSLEEKILEAQEFIKTNLSDSSIPTAMMFSGGKDSVVVRHLLESCGINHVKYYYMASGIEGEYLKEYLTKDYNDIEWLMPENGNVFEDWKIHKFVPYPMGREKKYVAIMDRCYCCKSRYLIKAKVIKPYTNIIMGVRENDSSNVVRYNERIVSHQGKSYFQPVYYFTKQDIFGYVDKYNIKLCKEYELFGRTRTCPLCPIWPDDNNVLEAIQNGYGDMDKFSEVVKYCYNNNEYLREQFETFEEYFNCCLSRSKYIKKITNDDKYFIDPESGLKYSNETGSVVM